MGRRPPGTPGINSFDGSDAYDLVQNLEFCVVVAHTGQVLQRGTLAGAEGQSVKPSALECVGRQAYRAAGFDEDALPRVRVLLTGFDNSQKVLPEGAPPVSAYDFDRHFWPDTVDVKEFAVPGNKVRISLHPQHPSEMWALETSIDPATGETLYSPDGDPAGHLLGSFCRARSARCSRLAELALGRAKL